MWMLIRKNKKNHPKVYLYDDGYARIAAHKFSTVRRPKKDNKQ